MTPERARAARARITPHMRRTPLLSSPFLDEIAGRRLWVKPECLQHTGSFKYRGAYAAISALPQDLRARGIIAFSSGNHAQGIALAARQHGTTAVVIMPSDAPQIKADNTRALGAEVVLYERATQDRDAIGAALAQERGLTLIKPFDEPEVIAGQASVGYEIAEQALENDIDFADVITPIGGGGLAAGICLALADTAPGLRLRTAEPEGFDDAARSLKAGEIKRNTRLSGGICDAIVTPQPGALTFPILRDHAGAGMVVSEEACLRAIALAYERLKIVIEPGGAVALAAALFHGDDIKTDHVIVVASGGNIDRAIFQRALTTYG